MSSACAFRAIPAKYVVLNSASERVREAAARDVELQSRLFDAIGLGPEALVVLHVGSGEGGHQAGRCVFGLKHDPSPKTVVETRVVKHGRSLVLPQLRAHADMADPVAFE